MIQSDVLTQKLTFFAVVVTTQNVQFSVTFTFAFGTNRHQNPNRDTKSKTRLKGVLVPCCSVQNSINVLLSVLF